MQQKKQREKKQPAPVLVPGAGSNGSRRGEDTPGVRSEQFVKVPTDLLARMDVSLPAKILAAVIVDEMRGRRDVAIGTRLLADKLGSTRTDPVTRAIREVEAVGLLIVVRMGNGRRTMFRLPDAKTVPKTGTLFDTPTVPESGTVSPAAPKARPSRKAGRKRPEKRDGSVPETGTRPDSDSDYAARSGGGASKTAHAQIVAHFTDRWAARFGSRYPFNGKKDPPAVKRLLEAVGGDVERAKGIVEKYIGEADDWTVKRGATLALLASNGQLPRYLATTAPTASEGGSAPPPAMVNVDPRSGEYLRQMERAVASAQAVEEAERAAAVAFLADADPVVVDEARTAVLKTASKSYRARLETNPDIAAPEIARRLGWIPPASDSTAAPSNGKAAAEPVAGSDWTGRRDVSSLAPSSPADAEATT